MSQWVYFFGEGKAEGNGKQKELLGGKGAGLAEMTNLGIPVPPGFTITTEVCTYYYANGQALSRRICRGRSRTPLARVERIMGRKFGDPANPLLFSVRSGARASMPGMMDTVLNLGLNDATVRGPGQGHGQRALRVGPLPPLRGHVRRRGPGAQARRQERGGPLRGDPREGQARGGREVRHGPHHGRPQAARVKLFKAEIKRTLGVDFPEDVYEQLWGAIGAVFGSLDERPRHRLPQALRHPRRLGHGGQRPDHGLRQPGRELGHGRGLHARPGPGRQPHDGEFLINAQGEDVVAGIRTPRPIAELESDHARGLPPARGHPAPPREPLPRHAGLRVHHRGQEALDAPDAHGQAHRFAAARMAVDMETEGLITEKEAVLRPEADGIAAFLSPIFDQAAKKAALREGHGHRQGPPRRPRRRLGPGHLQRRRRRGVGQQGREGPPRPQVHEPRGHPRHERGPGHPHGHGRHDLPRGARGPPDGQGLHRGLRRARHRLREGRRWRSGTDVVKEGDWLSIDGFTAEVILGQLAHAAQRGGAGPLGRAEGRGVPQLPAVHQAHELGRRAPQAQGLDQRRHARPGRDGGRSSAPRASASAAPSTCSSRASASTTSAG